jgi:hypothetical protein
MSRTPKVRRALGSISKNKNFSFNERQLTFVLFLLISLERQKYWFRTSFQKKKIFFYKSKNAKVRFRTSISKLYFEKKYFGLCLTNVNITNVHYNFCKSRTPKLWFRTYFEGKTSKL